VLHRRMDTVRLPVPAAWTLRRGIENVWVQQRTAFVDC
jgi:hypothetical protein